tara:strand:+ start:1073 stop:1951 length:879 start_codon:yes stop_codon:yes gene_type:complete
LPELPEVETVRKGLEKKTKNFIIDKIEILRSSTIAFPVDNNEFINGISQSKICTWKRRGKYLIANLQKFPNSTENKQNPTNIRNGYLVIHLRMTGYFNWIEKTIPPCNHTRVRFFDKHKRELRFVDVRSFGQIWWIKDGLNPKKIINGLGSLGPEPFGKDFNLIYLQKEFSNRTKSVKSVLLDQKIIAGIGNIYADESLYEAGISPFREAKTINDIELKKLRSSIIQVLKKSIGSGGTTFRDFRNIEGINGDYSMKANVYRRAGKKCNKCNNLIQRKKISGRSTHWCDKCQK